MYFQDPEREEACYTHGYPVICNDCWSELTKPERKEAKRAGLQLQLSGIKMVGDDEE